MHRMQIKPSNILLDARGEARLADFGLARVAKQRAGTDATVASVSAVCGTAAFLDPI
jgi:serine/threonine protein kinase